MAHRAATAVHRHHPRQHAAVRTGNYVFSQLIPYIGNKRRLLPLIAQAIAHTGTCPPPGRTTAPTLFVDLFSGSSVVARMAKTMGFRTLANDWEPYAHQIARGTVALNAPPAFAALGGPAAAFATLNALPPVSGYITRHLCPRDDQHPDPDNERLFFTAANGQRIDAIRAQLAAWRAAGQLSDDGAAYVLAAFIYAVSYVSNTSGVFKGFHHGWGGRTGTALYRILSPLTLRPPVLLDNAQANLALRMDAQELAGQLRDLASETPTIVYIDPPYNQHPYGSNYHVLNTVALGDEPPLLPHTRVNGRTVEKSAIRRDWRTLRRSAYNSARQAPAALSKLIAALDARWLLLSYSTDGNIPLDQVLAPLAERGRLEVFTQKYKRYRVSTPRMSPRGHNVEFVAVVDMAGKPSPGSVGQWVEQITGSA